MIIIIQGYNKDNTLLLATPNCMLYPHNCYKSTLRTVRETALDSLQH